MNDVAQLVDDIEGLPTLPDVVARINELVTDANASARDINDVISRDVSLSARILKLVNSPFYGFSRRITTITYAVVILGYNTVRNLALSAFVFESFKSGAGGGMDLKGFWQHSIGTAVAGSVLAKRAGGINPDDAFMAGLLHDVGKVILNQYRNDDLQRVLTKVREDNCTFLEAERATLPFDHTQIGAALLEKWNLPPGIVMATRYHHDPGQLTMPEAAPLVQHVHLADIVSRALLIGDGGDRRIVPLSPSVWEALGIGWDSLDEAMGLIAQETAKAGDFLEV